MAQFSPRTFHSNRCPIFDMNKRHLSFITHYTAKFFLASLFLTGSLLSGCSSDSPTHKHFSFASPNGGIVVADEPQAALIGRDILARGGNAVDAATASAFALSVTLPSRASLGGGGACLVSPSHKEARAFLFLPPPASGTGTRPAGVPMMARGLYMMQVHYGHVQFADLLTPAINLSHYGFTVSQTLSDDLNAVRIPLSADDIALSTFGKNDGSLVQTGDLLTQPRLTAFLSRLKLIGVGDLYNGALSEVFTTEANQAGAGLSRNDLRQSLPQEEAPLTLDDGHYHFTFLPPPADGGLGVAMAYKYHIPAEEAVSAWRMQNLESQRAAQNALKNKTLPSGGALPPLPASSSLIVTDRTGMVVACNFSENNLFGTGRIAGSTGIVLAASPINYPKPLLNATILHESTTGKLVAALASSGQNDAAQETANALSNITAHQNPRLHHTQDGQLNLIDCSGQTCQGSVDSASHGLSAITK